MTKTVIQDRIYKELEPLFPGFRLKRSDEGFVRTIANGSQAILVPITDFSPTFFFSLMFCVRLDEVERIIDRFVPPLPRNRSISLTSATPLQYFFPRHPGEKRYEVSSVHDVRRAAQSVATVSSQIMRFMDQHQDVHSLHASMNSADGRRFDSSANPYRAMHALILAYLDNRRDFERLVAEYQTQVQGWHEEDQSMFNHLVSYLSQGGGGENSSRASPG